MMLYRGCKAHREVCKVLLLAGIAELSRQERGTIECAIELVDTGLVRIFHVNGMQTVNPLVGQLGLHLFECLSGGFSFEVATTTFTIGKR